MKTVINFIRLLFNLHRINIEELVNYEVNSSISNKSKFLGSHNITNSSVGDYTYIAPNAHLSFVEIGKYCSIGPNFFAGWGIHPVDGISTSPMFYSILRQNGYSVVDVNLFDERKRIVIGNDVFIGSNVVVLDGVTIGDGSIIGAGAVVSKNIPPYSIAVGCPIRIIKMRFTDTQISALSKIMWWDKSDDVHLDIVRYFNNIDEFIEKYSV